MTLLGAWTHSLDAVALHLGPVTIYWYGLAYLAGFVIAALALRTMAARGWVRFPKDKVVDLILAIGLFGVFIGGRLGYVLIYRRDLIFDFTNDLPFWGVLRVHEGGMASHGGMIGVLLVLWWSARRMKVSMLHLLDAACLVAPAGLLLGRIANFVNGELLGKIIMRPGDAGTAPWYGVRFWHELIERPGESGWDQAQQFEAMMLARALPGEPIEVVCERLAAVYNENADGARGMIEPLLSVRHPSQLYQALAEGIALAAVLWWIWRKPRRDGVILSWFLIVYGVGRIITEFWRLPDAHLGAAARLGGLSRGQWLSAMMVVGGIALLGWVMRRADTPTSGGWARRATNSPAPDGADTGLGDESGSGESA